MPNDTTISNNLSHFLKWERELFQSRDHIDILAAQNLALGAVLGKVTAGTVPTTGTVAGTGNGTCTSVTGGVNVKVGDYVAECVGVVTNGGIFSVVDPDGIALPAAYVGQVYVNPQINFTINDGATDFALGDTITITVPAGGLQHRAINFSGVDGSAKAVGLLVSAIDASAPGTVTLAYTSGGTYEILPGDYVVGATGGATARVVSLTLTSGTWAGGDAAGTLTMDNKVGTFQAENLNVLGNSNVATVGGASTAVAATDKKGVAVVRDAEIAASGLVWPAGATATQKAAALAELAVAGIIVRDEA